MNVTYRSVDNLTMAFIEEDSEFEFPADDPRTVAPLDLRKTFYKFDRGLQDVPVIFRGDDLVLEASLIDRRGNAHPALLLPPERIELAVRQLVPTNKLLFIVEGTIVDAAKGRVDFPLTATETDQALVDEALLSVRIERTPGTYTTFETDKAHFRDSAFTPSSP